ncbi:MAG TPA: radical SAM protein [Candidatus Eisenbacteria bacterium]
MTATARIREQVLATDRLHLILMPTEACNLRCTYCYEDFRMGRMPEDVVAGVERLIERRASALSYLDISWFGGEPLAASDTVIRIMAHARDVAAASAGLTVRSDMTTNAWYLTPTLFERLNDLGVVKYQVSFDGAAAVHDTRRVRKGGGPTFERLWGHLKAMKATDREFTVMLRLHVSADNLGSVAEFLELVRLDLDGDRRFRIYPKLLARWGGARDAALPVMSAAEGKVVVESLRERAATAGIPLVPLDPADTVCYAARSNAIVVRADGRLNKCTLALEAAENQVGRLRPDGRFDLDPARLLPWMRGLESGKLGELACPKRGLVGIPTTATITSPALETA